jgi:hypothetical protein
MKNLVRCVHDHEHHKLYQLIDQSLVNSERIDGRCTRVSAISWRGQGGRGLACSAGGLPVGPHSPNHAEPFRMSRHAAWDAVRYIDRYILRLSFTPGNSPCNWDSASRSVPTAVIASAPSKTILTALSATGRI